MWVTNLMQYFVAKWTFVLFQWTTHHLLEIDSFSSLSRRPAGTLIEPSMKLSSTCSTRRRYTPSRICCRYSATRRLKLYSWLELRRSSSRPWRRYRAWSTMGTDITWKAMVRHLNVSLIEKSILLVGNNMQPVDKTLTPNAITPRAYRLQKWWFKSPKQSNKR